MSARRLCHKQPIGEGSYHLTMDAAAIRSLLDAIRRLPPAERLAFADEVDRLAWRDRVQLVLDQADKNARGKGGAPSDDEIASIVRDVRAEKSLFERYWTLRRSSAA